jgi:hypothetical protein
VVQSVRQPGTEDEVAEVRAESGHSPPR